MRSAAVDRSFSEAVGEGGGQIVGDLAVQQLERLRRVGRLLAARAGEQRIGRIEDLHERQAQLRLSIM